TQSGLHPAVARMWRTHLMRKTAVSLPSSPASSIWLVSACRLLNESVLILDMSIHPLCLTYIRLLLRKLSNTQAHRVIRARALIPATGELLNCRVMSMIPRYRDRFLRPQTHSKNNAMLPTNRPSLNRISLHPIWRK
ncbi:hypothetical protein DXG01_017255, partial [Tephrocybe rancida]